MARPPRSRHDVARVPDPPGDLSPCPTCGATHLRLYTIAEVAELFGVSPGWVYERIRDGKIRVTQLGATRGKWRISTPEVVRLINEWTA